MRRIDLFYYTACGWHRVCLAKVDNMPLRWTSQRGSHILIIKKPHCLDIVVELNFLLREGIEEGVDICIW